MNRQDVLALDRKFIWHPYTQEKIHHEKRPPLVIERAEGCHIFDMDGQSYIDGNGSWWTQILGHRHPAVMQAVSEQLERMPHVAMAGLTHEPAVLAAKALIDSAPEKLQRVFFSDNGSTAVEVALKMSFQHFQNIGQKNKKRFVSLKQGFHGETLGAVSVGGIDLFHRLYDPLLFDVHQVASPGFGDLELAWNEMQGLLERDHASICAVLVEPMVQGVAGMRFYPAEYLRRLRELTQKLDVLLIADEVFSGLGRTGRFWAVEHAGISPDLLCTSKALAGGVLPFAATLVREDIYRSFYGEKTDAFYYGHTFTGHPLGCAAAIATLREIRTALPELEGICASFGDEMTIFSGMRQVREVRTLGLIGAVELDGEGYLDEIGWKVYDEALKRGLYARPLGHVLYLLPSIGMSRELRVDMIGRLHDATRAAF